MKFEYFRKKLEAEKAKLESEMMGIGRKNPRVPGDWELLPLEADMESDLADQADVVTNRESDTALLADLEARYDAVLSALERVKKRTFGICEVCGEEIKQNRLEANPAATTCVKHL